MKKTRKISGLLAAVILCTSLISGCGSNADKTQTKDGETPTLTWYVPGKKQQDMQAVMAAANAISESKIGAKLDLQMIDDGAFEEKMNLMMSSQKVFDLCFSGYINRYISGVQKGGFYDMTEAINSLPALKESIPDYAWKTATIDGKIYGVPNLQIMAIRHGIFVQKQYLDKYAPNLTEIEDESDLEDFFAELKKNETDVYPSTQIDPYGLWYDKYESIMVTPLLVSEWDDPKHTIKWFADTPEYKEMLELRRRWYENGYVRPDVDTVTETSLDYKNGKYAISPNGNWKPGIESERLNRGIPDEVFFETNETVLPNEAGRDTMIAISSTSKNPELAVKLIELLNTDKEYYNTICFGIEGKHYEKLSDGHIKLIDDSGYTQNASWKFGNQFNAYLMEGQADNLWEETAKLNDEAKKSSLIGFIPDTRPITSELAQCTSVEDEFSILKTCSEEYEEYYDEYVKRMEAAGIRKVVDELNNQIQKWLSTQK